MNNWTNWKSMPSPETCRLIEGPKDELGKDLPGVYQIRHVRNNTTELIQFGISKNCRKRMKSFFPAPHGTGTRNKAEKREYVLKHWKDLQYRTIGTLTRGEAVVIENQLKARKNHKFNT